MKNLAKAVIAVMKDVKGVEKSMTVGSGNYSYKGVSDYEVKKTYNKSMSENGLCILPIGIEESTDINRWEETNQYGTKQKMSVFTKVTTKYLLLHESGESQEIVGYGHGVDTSDKSAGKSTTYALKYALLYAFMTPTGAIHDTDNDHSDDAVSPIVLPVIDAASIASFDGAASKDLITPNKQQWLDWLAQFKQDETVKGLIKQVNAKPVAKAKAKKETK